MHPCFLIVTKLSTRFKEARYRYSAEKHKKWKLRHKKKNWLGKDRQLCLGRGNSSHRLKQQVSVNVEKLTLNTLNPAVLYWGCSEYLTRSAEGKGRHEF